MPPWCLRGWGPVSIILILPWLLFLLFSAIVSVAPVRGQRRAWRWGVILVHDLCARPALGLGDQFGRPPLDQCVRPKMSQRVGAKNVRASMLSCIPQHGLSGFS